MGIVRILALLSVLLLAAAPGRAQSIDETSLVAMMDQVIRYYDETRPAEAEILKMLPKYESYKEGVEYKKTLFLFETHQKVTISLNNLIDILYIFLKAGNYRDKELNEYVYNRSKNNITYLNNMLYFLTVKNQEFELKDDLEVQKAYVKYLVGLTSLLYELNKDLVHFQEGGKRHR